MDQQTPMQQPPQGEAPKSNVGMLLVVLVIVVVAAIAVWYFYIR